MITFTLLLLAVGATVGQSQQLQAALASDFVCPLDEDGFFPDPYQCDKYYNCRRGEKEERFCPDGLFFDHNQPLSIETCDYPFHIDCQGDVQPSTGRGVCIYANGIFEHEDLTNCVDYYECNNNDARMLSCAFGLHFDPEMGNCQWIFASTRTGCVEELVALENGFKCTPTDVQVLLNGHELAHNRYVLDTDCRSFIICENKKVPRITGCDQGTVFSDHSKVCESPEKVPDCAHYYDEVAAGGADAPVARRR